VTETQGKPSSVADEQPARKRRLNPKVKTALQALISLVLIGFIIWFVFRQFADFSSVLEVLRTLTWTEALVLAAIAVWNLITYWVVVVIATPGLRVPQAAVLTQTTTAVANTVPAGGAISVGLTYSIMSSWGFSKSRTTLSVVVTGIWNNFLKLGLPIVALAIILLQGQSGGGRLIAALAGLAGLVGAIVVFALILRSEDFARKTGLVTQRWASALLRLFHRGPAQGWDIAITTWRSRVIGLVRYRWLPLTLSVVVSHLSLYAVLLVCLRVMGVSPSEVGWAQVLLVFAFARLVTAIPLTPGGVGVIELAMIAGLTSAGGEAANVVAGVLLYRLLTYVLPIVTGAGTYVFWRRNRSWRNSAPPLNLAMAGAGDTSAGDVSASQTPPDDTRRPVSRRRLRAVPVRRRWLDVGWLVGGLALFALCGALAAGGLRAGEDALFSAINGLPDALMPVVWPFMQYGVFLTIPVLCLVALLLRQVRLAVAMAIAGVGVYFLARVVKEFVQRGRPEALLDGVVIRETFASGSLGFPSGHTAVAGALTVVVTPYLPGRWKVVPVALLVAVFVGRMYVAAHLPLDLVGGAALGLAAGGLANLLVGAPAPRSVSASSDLPAQRVRSASE
jgi:putative heme transporter